MSSRPGAPQSVTDEYLKAILAELRELNARLSQDTVQETVTVETAVEYLVREHEGTMVDPEDLTGQILNLLHPGRGAAT